MQDPQCATTLFQPQSGYGARDWARVVTLILSVVLGKFSYQVVLDVSELELIGRNTIFKN